MSMPVFDKSNKMHYLETGEVFSVYKEDKTRKIIVKAESGEYYLPTTLEQIVAILEPLGFVQIDKNKIINLNRIKCYEDGAVTVDGTTYDIARRRLKYFIQKLIDNRSRDTKGKE